MLQSVLDQCFIPAQTEIHLSGYLATNLQELHD